jgi:hypothetical protein
MFNEAEMLSLVAGHSLSGIGTFNTRSVKP